MTELDGATSVREEDAAPPNLTHGQIFLRFLRFGLLAWGGPVAQIGMLRRELVDEERWVSSPRFNRLLAVYQVLPGPEAHELCVHLGMLPGGRLGGFLAGLGFMLPGFVLMFALSWLYFVVDLTAASVGAAFLGVQVAVIALIVRAVHRIGKHAILDVWLWAIAIASAGAALAGVSFWITLTAAGCLYPLCKGRRYSLALLTLGLAVLAIALTLPQGGGPDAFSTAEAPLQPVTPMGLFLSGLKAGLLTFGGAYTVIPFLRDDAVGKGWMTDAQFLDGLALSGILPAPLIIFSTFVGYFGGGPVGAIAMTVGIFLPAFSFSLLFHRHLEKVIENRALHAFLAGVTAGVVGLITATTIELALVAAGRVPTPLWGGLIFTASLAVLYRCKAKTNVVFVVLGAGLVGWLAFGVS